MNRCHIVHPMMQNANFLMPFDILFIVDSFETYITLIKSRMYNSFVIQNFSFCWKYFSTLVTRKHFCLIAFQTLHSLLLYQNYIHIYEHRFPKNILYIYSNLVRGQTNTYWINHRTVTSIPFGLLNLGSQYFMSLIFSVKVKICISTTGASIFGNVHKTRPRGGSSLKCLAY